MTSATKVCSKCRRRYPIEAFGRRRRNADGRENQCRNCINRYRRSYRQHGDPGFPRVVVEPHHIIDESSVEAALAAIRAATDAQRPVFED